MIKKLSALMALLALCPVFAEDKPAQEAAEAHQEAQQEEQKPEQAQEKK